MAIVTVANEAFLYILWFLASGLPHALVISKFVMDSRTHKTSGWFWFIVHGLGAAAAAVAAFMRAMIMLSPPADDTVPAEYNTWISGLSFALLQAAALTAWVVATGKHRMIARGTAGSVQETVVMEGTRTKVDIIREKGAHENVYIDYNVLSFAAVLVAWACSAVEMGMAFHLSTYSLGVVDNLIAPYGLVPYAFFHTVLLILVAYRKFSAPMWSDAGAAGNYSNMTRRVLGQRVPLQV